VGLDRVKVDKASRGVSLGADGTFVLLVSWLTAVVEGARAVAPHPVPLHLRGVPRLTLHTAGPPEGQESGAASKLPRHCQLPLRGVHPDESRQPLPRSLSGCDSPEAPILAADLHEPSDCGVPMHAIHMLLHWNKELQAGMCHFIRFLESGGRWACP